MLKDLGYITSGACDILKKGFDATVEFGKKAFDATCEIVNRVPANAKILTLGAGGVLVASNAHATDPTSAAAEMVAAAITELGNRATQVGTLGVAFIAVIAVMGVIGVVTGFLRRK